MTKKALAGMLQPGADVGGFVHPFQQRAAEEVAVVIEMLGED
ncbi:MAG: hypothetical protein ACTFAK_16675 [Candidatus Electronema sp. VV]